MINENNLTLNCLDPWGGNQCPTIQAEFNPKLFLNNQT